MPFIDVKASCPITPEQEAGLKTQLGQAIAMLPGQTEESLMLRFTGQCRMWHAGAQNGPIVMVEAAIYGSAPSQAVQSFGSFTVKLLKETLDARTVYFNLRQSTDWAW